jgi:hypothetical protein
MGAPIIGVAASGAAAGAAYCGITAGAATGGQGAAVSGTYAGVAGPQYAPRLNQLHGLHGHAPNPQQLHPPAMAGIVATASTIRIFFIVLSLLRKQPGDYCLGRNV